MAINVENLNRISQNELSVQHYKYRYDNTYKEIINDGFFDIVKFEPSYYIDLELHSFVFYDCHWKESNLYHFIFSSGLCVQQLSFSLEDAFHFSKKFYRYYNDDYTYFTGNIYQDMISTSVELKGFLTKCEISDINFMDLFDCVGVYIGEIIKGSDVTSCMRIFNKISNADQFVLKNVSINVPIINNPFSQYSYGYKCNFIPIDLNCAILEKSTFDINLGLTIENFTAVGQLQVTVKSPAPISLGVRI